jgi:hypothetical protein
MYMHMPCYNPPPKELSDAIRMNHDRLEAANMLTTQQRYEDAVRLGERKIHRQCQSKNSKTGQRYIHITKNNSYAVIMQKSCKGFRKTCKTLEEAIQVRDAHLATYNNP